MDSISKEIELGILQDKSLKWVEPHESIYGAIVTIEAPLNKYIKWYKRNKKIYKDNKRFQKRTIDSIYDSYIVNWAWIE